ncbi:MAG: sugar transferase [candidate division KSB1 bacterium]|nr:sugar transferase [candidate division KSB1 bacterium]
MIEGAGYHIQEELFDPTHDKFIPYPVAGSRPCTEVVSQAMPPAVHIIGRSEKFYETSKRLLDIILALFGLIVLLPLLVLIGCVIKLDSPGPVIFKQQRIGKNRRYHSNGHLRECRRRDLKGTPFFIYKFRTMKQNVEPYASSPGDNGDPRLTRIGRILRQTCLDELPQLINVIKGEMSLVGPRPEMPFIVQNYNQLEALRLKVKPGITGLWQLYGSRKKHIHENLQYDLDYISQHSLLLDLKIMLKTIGFVIGSKNV